MSGAFVLAAVIMVAILALCVAAPRIRAWLATPLGAGLVGGLAGALIATAVFSVMLREAETRMVEATRKFVNWASKSAIAEMGHETEATLQALADAEARLKAAEAAVNPAALPPGAVVAFDLRDGCPDGWRPFDSTVDQLAIVSADTSVGSNDSAVGSGSGALGLCRKG